MAEDAVAFVDALLREGGHRILEIFGVLAGRQRREEGTDAVGVGGVLLQPLAERRQQRLQGGLGLLLRQVELPRQRVDARAVLGVGHHFEQVEHLVLLCARPTNVEGFHRRLKWVLLIRMAA